MKHKKKIISTCVLLLAIVLAATGININNRLEWEIANDLIASGGFPVELGVSNSIITPCVPSCQTPAGVATCCAPQTNNCPLVVPGTSGTYDSACPLFSDVRGKQEGGMGNNAVLSNIAIAQAGLASGGQFIFGGTINNMSLMVPGAPNVVLASIGGCYNCLSKMDWKEKLAKKFKYFIAGFKD
jgi:hypothetical protein